MLDCKAQVVNAAISEAYKVSKSCLGGLDILLTSPLASSLEQESTAMSEVENFSSRCCSCKTISANSSHQNLDCISTISSRSPRQDRKSAAVWLRLTLIFCCFSIFCHAESTTVTEVITESPPPTTYIPKPPIFNPADCSNSFDSYDQKLYICARHTNLFGILKYAEHLAKNTCENHFQNELWNCTGFSLLNQPNVTKGDDVFKESAYVYALSLAVIAHSVAKGCAQGLVTNCTDNNVEYALDIAETFLNKRYTSAGSSLKLQLAQHNFRVAKLIIQQLMNSTEKTCHCHGISGSCTFSICHSELPEFEQVAKNVKKAYENSCRVTSTGQSQNQWVSQCGRDYTESDMIYRDIANWCQVNPFTGSVGVVGRECSPHQDAPNSCKKLCNDQCGRGSKDFIEVQKKQCGCKFLFCCEILCDMCTEERKYYRCT